MKILHVVAGNLSGGAARGAYWLHCGLKEIGVDSKVYTNSKRIIDDETIVYAVRSQKQRVLNVAYRQLDALPAKLYIKRKPSIFSTGIVGLDLSKVAEVQEADIVHLHWVNGGFVNIKSLAKLNKPIVWTMRDMWPLTGGCHYAMGCEKYKTGCGGCEQLRSNSNYDLSKLVSVYKNKYFPPSMVLVGISNWLSGKAKESFLFKGFDIRTIPNAVDLDSFYPVKKEQARKKLGIDTRKKIILIGSTRLEDFYKGLSKFQEASVRLDKNSHFLCVFGNANSAAMDGLGFEFKNLGYLNNDLLRLAYSCADVFVAPSIMEAFGKTLVESMACGTPVVCFDASGPKDIVSHKVDGYKAKPFESEDLAHGIEWVLNNANFKELSNNARIKAVNEFDSRLVAEKYHTLYKEVLSLK